MRLSRLAAALLGLALAAPVAEAVEVQARLERPTLHVGESTSLEIVVRGAMAGIGDPEFPTPPAIEVLGSGESRNFSFVNGRASSEAVFRYEITATAPGTFTLGPIRVKVGRDSYVSPPVTLRVAAGAPSVGGSARGVASLLVDVVPSDPWVGQPVRMRVRLVLRAPLAEDPSYTPPPTTGFWADPPSRPESYYALQSGERVLVTETRTRLYPLGAGTVTLGPASALLALSVPGSDDPLLWATGRQPRREEVTVRSHPVAVHARPLPGGAPPGFDGAVGNFTVAWTADRAGTSQDVPLVVRLDVHGLGNLPLLHTPELRLADAEVYAGTVEDSVGPPGSDGGGRRRFQWSVLPKHPGRLRLEAPRFVWFDVASARYRVAAPPAIEVPVGPPLAGTAEAEILPAAFTRHEPAPGGRPAQPWLAGIAGVLLGGAIVAWRRPPRTATGGEERSRVDSWRRTLRSAARAGGTAEFWHAAEEATAWLESRGRGVGDVRAAIARARYGGGAADPAAIARDLVAGLEAQRPPAARATFARPLAGVLALGAIALAVLAAPRPGSDRARQRLLGGDHAARAGDLDGARKEWSALWREGARSAGLAARLAWLEIRVGSIGRAAAWALRGEARDPRDPALAWVEDRIREGGGLTGARTPRLPLRAVEWGVLALAFGIAAGALWPRRAAAAAALALALIAAGVPAVERAIERGVTRAVVTARTPLEGAGVDLEPGEVVRVESNDGRRARVSAGRDIEGWVPATAIDPVERPS